MTRYFLRLLLMLATFVGTPAVAVAQSEVVEYYATDALGSIRVVFDATGNVTGRADYRPFGQLFASSGNQKNVYAGIFSDPETDLDFAQARMYQARTGRLTRLDPVYAGLFEPQKWNRYTYVQSNPLKYVDPTGLDGCTYLNGNIYCDVTVKAVTTSVTLTGMVANALSSLVTDPLAKPGYTGPKWGEILATRTAPGIVVSDVKQLVSPESSKAERGEAAAGIVLSAAPVPLGVGAKAIARRLAAKTIANPVPSTMARVIPDGIPAMTLGRPGAADVFVTAADDIAGMNASQIANRLGIPQSQTGFRVIEFPTPHSGVASPVFRTDPGFVVGGLTSGGAREFVIPNGSILPGSVIRIVQ